MLNLRIGLANIKILTQATSLQWPSLFIAWAFGSKNVLIYNYWLGLVHSIRVVLILHCLPKTPWPIVIVMVAASFRPEFGM